jgi:ribose-phosphate pyrophosphokinase
MNGLYRFDAIFTITTFPSGETHVEAKGVCPLSDGDTVSHWTPRFSDIVHVVSADNILKHRGINVTWFLPFLPGARHDRKRHAMDGIELHVLDKLLEGLDVICVDPHSDVTGSKYRHFPQSEVVRMLLAHGALPQNPTFVIPDQGAIKKAHEWVFDAPTIECSKVRDVQTGDLSGFKVEGVAAHVDFGSDLVMVDDICDGGGTFIGLVAALRECHLTGPIHLVVSHGLFTKGTEVLLEHFDSIKCLSYDEITGVTTFDYDTLIFTGDYKWI